MPSFVEHTQLLLDQHQYAVIDQVLFPHLPAQWGLMALMPAGFKEEAQAQLFPALLPLHSLTPAIKADCLAHLQAAHEQGQPLPIQTLLKTQTDINGMRGHWQSQLVVRSQQGDQALLRSYDPRVWIHLQWLLSPVQLAQLHGPIETWTTYLPYHHNTWHSHHKPDAQLLGQPLPDRMQPRYDQPTYQTLFRLGTINSALTAQPKQPLSQLMAQAKAFNDLLIQAQTHGLQRVADQKLFLDQAMQYGPHFYTHPILQELLKTLDPEEQTYEDAVALLTQAQWQQIAAHQPTISR